MAANDRNSLIDRYLYAVSRYLPAQRHDDLLTELAANLHSEMEDKAAALGRPLTEEEQADVLRHHGPPLVVAARYQPQRSLIGPEIFPFYAFTVKRLLPLVIGVNLLAQAAAVLFGSAQVPIAQRFHFGSVLHDLIYAALMFLVTITVAFALIEVYEVNFRKKLEQHKWDPRKLPKAQPVLHDGPRHPWADAIASAFFLAWLLSFPRFPVLMFGPYVAWHLLNIDLPVIWHQFYWIIIAFNAIQLASKVALLARPVRRYYHLIDSVIHLLGIGAIAFLLRAHDYIGQASFGGSSMSPETVATLNANIHRGLLFVLLFAAAKFLWDTAQWLRPKPAPRIATKMGAPS
ncbi:MAG TPA: hypothetical protein VE109_12305 [Acidobacteriaceae bacterium]|nr:hypothetical protein [Acidobacteriaceae bacterium]